MRVSAAYTSAYVSIRFVHYIHTFRDTMRVSTAEGRSTNEDVKANHPIIIIIKKNSSTAEG